MTFSGDLQNFGLGDVFQNISTNQVTGSLHVRWRNGERFVRFESGEIAGFSLGVGKGLPLIEHIRQRGILDETGLENLRKKRKRSRKSPGRLLVEMNLLTEEQLKDIFAQAVEEHIYDLMALTEAQFSFTEGDPPSRVFDMDQRTMELRLQPGPLLLEGARRKDEWERIHRVIGSDRDLFVALEGWDQVDLEPIAEQVAAQLNGRTDIKALLKQVSGSRFDVMKSVSELVLRGLARRCTADEIQSQVQEAVSQGRADDAVNFLNQALAVEQGNPELRNKLAELYEQLSRPHEAAAEYASLGYQAAQENRLRDALTHYNRAAELNPGDLVLHERQVELLVRNKDGAGLAKAVEGLVTLQLDVGLADRARSTLQGALDSKLLPDEAKATERLAEVESSLGNSDVAADLFLQLASLAKKQEGPALEYLKKALSERPHDQALAARIEDMQTGREYRRKIRRRRLMATGAVASLLLAIGSAGIMEITAGHRVRRALALGLGPLENGEGITGLRDLQDVEAGFAWTLSGRRAGEHAEELLELHLETARDLLDRGEHGRAADLLGQLQAIVRRSDIVQRCKALGERIELEREASAMLSKAERMGAEAPEALEALEGRLAKNGNLLDFYLTQLPRLQCSRARQAVLRALEQMNQPRTLAVVAKLSLRERDPESKRLILRILDQAEAHRRRGRHGEWESVYPELERAKKNPETRDQAKAVLGVLQGTRR